jgi:hypothetical protein
MPQRVHSIMRANAATDEEDDRVHGRWGRLLEAESEMA